MTMAFILTMPSNNSWNGKWTGDDRLYVVTRRFQNDANAPKPGRYTHNFGDGWVAAITAKEVTTDEARELVKKSKGFCGYEWMVDSIIKDGRVIARYTSGEVYATGTAPE